MQFDKSIVEYTAKLARIKLGKEELGSLSLQLRDVLKYVEKLNKLDTTNVLPTSHVLPLKNVYRQDKIKESLDSAEAVANAPAREGAYFKVPRIIE